MLQRIVDDHVELVSPAYLTEKLGARFTRPVATSMIRAGVMGTVYDSQRGLLVAKSEVDRLADAGYADFAPMADDPITTDGIFFGRAGAASIHSGEVRGVYMNTTWDERAALTAGPWHVGIQNRKRLRSIVAKQGFVPMVVLIKSWPAWGFEITGVPSYSGSLTFQVRPPGDWYDEYIADRWFMLGRGSASLIVIPSEQLDK